MFDIIPGLYSLDVNGTSKHTHTHAHMYIQCCEYTFPELSVYTLCDESYSRLKPLIQLTMLILLSF